jgi:diguanylate cyclase (GGDEF)-like protein
LNLSNEWRSDTMTLLGEYPFSTLLSFVVFLLLSLYAMRYRKSPGAAYFIATMLLITFNSLASIYELTTNSFAIKLWWRNVQQIPLFISPFLMLGLILELIGVDHATIKRRLRLLMIPAFIYIVLICTDGYHHLLRADISLESFGSAERIRVQSTHLSLLFIVYIQVIGLAPILVLLQQFRKVSPFYRNQYGLVMAGLASPYAIFLLAGIAGFDVSVAVAALPLAALLFYALFRYKLLRVRPLAREKVFEVIKDAIIVMDPQDVIIDANPSGLRLLEKMAQTAAEFRKTSVIGENITQLFAASPDWLAFYKTKEQGELHLELMSVHYNISLLPFFANRHKTGTLLIFTDITERIQYEKELLHRATTDGLTQVYNRQYLIELANRAIADLAPENDSLSLMILDIDYFKSINDIYGHKFGDLVLEQFARILRETVGESGFVGRIGGEEFSVVLPNMFLHEARQLAEQIRQKVESAALETDSIHERIELTVSIGMTHTQHSNVKFKELYHRADEALYVSKNTGRNKITAV